MEDVMNRNDFKTRLKISGELNMMIEELMLKDSIEG
jgi:hypothetical protein